MDQSRISRFSSHESGAEKGGYWHEHFVRGKPSLCKKIKRKKTAIKAPPNLFARTLPGLWPPVPTAPGLTLNQIAAGLLLGADQTLSAGGGLDPTVVAALVLEQQRQQQEQQQQQQQQQLELLQLLLMQPQRGQR
jgi:hypothetical protein